MWQIGLSRPLRILITLLYCFIFQSVHCFGEPPPTVEQIEPADLPPTWWNFLEVEGEELTKRIDTLIEKSQEATENLSEANREKAQTLLEEIKRNFQAYTKIINQPLPVPKPPTPFVESYTIDKLIELNTRLQKTAIDLQGKTDERTNVQQQLEVLQDSLDIVRQKHLDAEERSETKILLALEKISLRPAIEVATTKIALLNKTIEIEKQDINYLQDEIDTAKDRLISSPVELSRLARQMNPSKRIWDDNKSVRQAKEAEVAKLSSGDSTEEAKTKNQTRSLELIEASLRVVEAHNNFIKTELLYSLALLLNEPEKIEIGLLNQSIKTWNTQLANFTQSLQEWFEQSGRIVQRSAELISLGDQEKEKPIYPRSEILQKNIELGQKNLLIIQGLGKEIDESLFLLGVVNEKSAALQGKGVQWLRIAGNFFYDALAGIKEKLGKTLFYIRNQPVTILSLFQFFLIVFVSWWISKILTRTINKIVRRRKGVRKAVIYRLNRLLHYVILVVGLLIALTMIGFDFSNLIIIAGALGVGLGFGLQSIFNNFISGIIILFQSHIKVGDYVELDNGIRGEIREINVRSTVISTNDGIEVLVPNSEMLSNRIINWTLRDPYRRVHVPFSVAYGSDIDEVARVIIEATNKVPSTLQKIGVPEPRVFLSKFGDNSLEMELVVWVNEKWTRRSNKTLSHYLWAIEKALRKHGFVIPFPQRDLHIIGAAKKKGKSKVPPHS